MFFDFPSDKWLPIGISYRCMNLIRQLPNVANLVSVACEGFQKVALIV